MTELVVHLPCVPGGSQVRWAVLNVVSLLRRHEAVQDRLADAMARGAGVAECIGVIEEALAGSSDI